MRDLAERYSRPQAAKGKAYARGKTLVRYANAVGAFDASPGVLAAATAGLRAQGRLGLLARALTQQAWSATQRVDLSLAIPVGEEAVLCVRPHAGLKP